MEATQDRTGQAQPAITEFLEARIAEDEAEAKEKSVAEYCDGGWSDEHAQRVLAECAAKRAIIRVHQRFDDVQRMTYGDIHPCTECGSVDESPVEWPCRTLKMVATVYADHPDIRKEWAV